MSITSWESLSIDLNFNEHLLLNKKLEDEQIIM